MLSEPYFEQLEPQIYDEPGTYVETGLEFRNTTTNTYTLPAVRMAV